MIQHWLYLKYLIRHKWYVALACFKKGLYWQGIIHDFSKFLPCEWIPYANHFYGDGNSNYEWAWLRHIHRNPHHWEHWVIPSQGTAETKNNVFKPPNTVIKMPEKYALEMLCDWAGAGKAQGVSGCTLDWYKKNRYNMILHQETREFIEELLETELWLKGY